jgi:hypothetical protein
MREEPDNLVFLYMRRIDEKIDRLTDDVQDLKHSVTSLEGQVASFRGDIAAISLGIDRIEKRASTGSSGGSISWSRRHEGGPNRLSRARRGAKRT